MEDTDGFRTKDRLTEAQTYVDQLKELGDRLAAYAKERDTINREEVLAYRNFLVQSEDSEYCVLQ